MLQWSSKADLRAEISRLRTEVDAEYQRAEAFARQTEILREQVRANEILSRVHEERASALRDTIETLKEQNRRLLDTLQGPDTVGFDPLATARRNLALTEADDVPEEDVDDSGRTLGERLSQYQDPTYVPASIFEKIRAAKRMAEEQAEEIEA